MTFDVIRHERQYDATALAQALGMHPRDAHTGRYLPMLPPFERADGKRDMTAMCDCGARRGLHRAGDEACPNRQWKPGNGRGQWLSDASFFARARAFSEAA